MIPTHIELLIKKYSEGFKGGIGVSPPIEANPIPDYKAFVEHWGKLKREGSIRNYLSILHKWNKPINKETISDWSEIVKALDYDRHEYKDTVVTINGKQYTYPRKHKYDLLNTDEIADNRKHFEYRLHRVMTMYLKAINNKELLELMPRVEDVPKIRHNVKKGHMSEEEFERFVSYIDDEQIKVMFLLMFYTGARIREVIQIKKNLEWFPNLKDDKIELKDGELFKTVIPKIYAKSKKDEETLYFVNKNIENAIIKYVNKQKESGFIFQFPGVNKSRIYLDEQRIKNIFRDKLQHYLSISGFSHMVGLLTPHSFRRGFVHYMYQKSGKDIVFTSKVTRHKSGVVMTDKYLQQDTEHVENKIKEMRK